MNASTLFMKEAEPQPLYRAVLDGLSLPVVLAALAVIVVAYQHLTAPSSTKGRLPPGPPGLPIVGNLFQLPKKRPWVKMEEWTREYGPIYTLKLGFQTLLVIGRADVAIEVLDKRSSKYSSRPRLIMTSDLVSRGLRLTFMPYGDLWRRERRLLHQLTNSRASAEYEPIQEQESAALLRDMIRNPKNFWGHCQRYAGSTIMQIAFNKRAPTFNDPAITDMRHINEQMTKTAVPGRYKVDSFPVLNMLPKMLAPWKREADAIFDDTLRLFRLHFDDVKAKAARGDETHCLARYIQELQKQYGLTDEQAIFTAGAMFGAGSDTTADAISTFIMIMTTHPAVQAKAQDELDRVVGRERLPDFTHQDDLPYVRAAVAEMMRWRTVIAGGLAHLSTEDDVLMVNGQEYVIPAGTSVLANHWAIHLDPELYPEPETFKPERFLQDGKFVGCKLTDRGHFGFGFGRRICPGMWIAERSLYIVFTRIMWALSIKPQRDPATGRELVPDVNAFSEGFSSHPLTFECDIKPRGKFVEDLVAVATENTA